MCQMQDCRRSLQEPKCQRNAAFPHAFSTLPLLGSEAVPTTTAFLHLPVTRDFFCITTIRNTHTDLSMSSAMTAASNFFTSYEILLKKTKPNKKKPPQNPKQLLNPCLIVQGHIFKDYLNLFWREILLHRLLSR